MELYQVAGGLPDASGVYGARSIGSERDVPMT